MVSCAYKKSLECNHRFSTSPECSSIHYAVFLDTQGVVILSPLVSIVLCILVVLVSFELRAEIAPLL